jgi:L-alanine-DL-glutamate epimerase-like enolase superfamily enzyme
MVQTVRFSPWNGFSTHFYELGDHPMTIGVSWRRLVNVCIIPSIMKITRVDCYLLGARSPSGYRPGSAIIRVETDQGIVGHGETLMGLFCAPAAKAITDYYAPLLIGKDPDDIGGLWRLMLDSSIWWGRAGAAVSVIGGIESALWDIRGLRAGKPCYQLINLDNRDSLPVYASLGSSPETTDDAAKVMKQLKQDGFNALKTGLQFGVSSIAPRGDELVDRLDNTLEVLRNHAPADFMIAVDGHSGGIPDPITREEALAVVRVLEKYDVNFFEEALSYRDPAGYAWLRQQSKVRIAGGESLSLIDGFATYLDIDALDVVQPDVNYVGGIGQAAEVVRMAQRKGLAAIPHAWCGGPGFMANVHLAFAFNFIERLEMPPEWNDLQTETILERPAVVDGIIHAPTAPGLGIRFDPSMASRFPYTPELAERASGLIVLTETGKQ